MALLDPRSRPFAAAQRRIAVELVEAELGVDLEDGPLVVGGDVALDLADPGQQRAHHRAQARAVLVVEHRAGRRRDDGRAPAGAEQAAGGTVGGPAAGMQRAGQADGGVEGHDLERGPVVEDLDERAQQLGRLGEQGDALELARHHQPASAAARLDAGQEPVGNGRARA